MKNPICRSATVCSSKFVRGLVSSLLFLAYATTATAGETTSFPASDGRTVTAYVATPAGAGPFPQVILLHGTEGYVASYRALADLFAAEGFLAITGCWFEGTTVPASFGLPHPDACPNGQKYTGANNSNLPEVRAMADFVRALPKAARGLTGVWGHSRGANMAFLLATSDSGIKAVYSASGVYAKAAAPANDVFPSTYIDKITMPVGMLHGTTDRTIPIEQAKAFAAAMSAAGRPVDVEYRNNENHNSIVMAPNKTRIHHAVEFFKRVLK